jgi:hypothetical protein
MGALETRTMADSTVQDRFVKRARHHWIAARCFLVLLGALLPFTLLAILIFGASLAWLAEVGSRWAYFGAAFVSGFVLPVIISLPILWPWASHWREPRRIVAFRRFHIAENRKLSKLLTRYFAPYGHVFTLADTRIHLSWTVRIPLFLGQLSFVHFRPRTVRDRGRLKLLSRLLGQRVRLNVNWLVSYRKLFAIRSSDEYWRACVDLLLERSDLALIDISQPSDALEWELLQCVERMPGRTILLAAEDQREIVERWMGLGGNMQDSIRKLPLFLHRKGRIVEEEEFRSLIAQRLVTMRYPSQPVSFLRTCASFAGNLSTSLAVAIATVILVTPFYLPWLALRYSPFRWQLEQVYYAEATLADTALARLDAMDHKATVESMIRHARSGPVVQSLDALAKIGDRSSVGPLWDVACASEYATRTQAANVLKQLAVRLGNEFVDESLSVLRAGRPNVNPWAAPVFKDLLGQVPRSEFERLLASRHATARFTAALRLAPEMDPRTVPVLLEMMRTSVPDRRFDWNRFRRVEENVTPLLNDGKTLLDGFGQHPEVRIEAAVLRPYLTGSDQAAFSAVWLALLHHHDKDLEAVLRTAESDSGVAAVSQLAECAKERGEPAAARAATLLKIGQRSVIDEMLAGADPLASARASVALAVRGDATSVRLALEAARVIQTRWLVMTTYPHEQLARAAVEYFCDCTPHPHSLPKPLEHLDELPISLFAPLIRLYASAGEDETAKHLIGGFVGHPSANSWFNNEDESVAAVVPPRLDAWFLAQGLAETDPHRVKAYTSVYGEMVRTQKHDGCRPNAFLGLGGTLAQWADACPLPAR